MSTCKRMWTDREIRSMAGDTATSLIESGNVIAPYKVVGNLNIENAWLNGLTPSNVYAKVIKEGNLLIFVLSAHLTNATESTITTGGSQSVASVSSIPSNISSKIYRKDGTKVSEPLSTSDNISGLLAYVSSSNGAEKSINLNCYSSSANNIGFWVGSSASDEISVDAGSSKDIDFRIYLVL